MFGGFGGLPKGAGKGDKSKLGPVQGPHIQVGVTPAVHGTSGVVGNTEVRVDPIRFGGNTSAPANSNVSQVWGGVSGGKYGMSEQHFAHAKEAGTLGIRWAGPLFDESGYGEACRNYVAALAGTGFPITSRGLTFGEPSVNYGKPGKISLGTLNLSIATPVHLVYSPPHYFKQYMAPGAYNIGMFAWEMQKLPNEWVSACNRMSEIWVPCQWNAQACASSGVDRPIMVFGHTVSPEEYSDGQSLVIPGVDSSLYKFYSVFQWTERKNPGCLLRAYLKAFTDADKVILIVKTYGQNYSQEEEVKVRAEIDKIRRQVGGRQPKMLLITRILSKDQMLALHRLGDCFVLPHRAEGWGLPHFEACAMGKPVITTDYGGNLEFTKPEHSYLVNSRQVAIRGMEWFKWFTPDMTWADADEIRLVDLLRHVYTHREEAAGKGAAAKRYVFDTFSWDKIGAAMKARLTHIVSGL